MASYSAPMPLFCCSEIQFTFGGHELLEPNIYTNLLIAHAIKPAQPDPLPDLPLNSTVCNSGIISIARKDILEQSLWGGVKRAEPSFRYFTLLQTNGNVNSLTEISCSKFEEGMKMGWLSKSRNFSTFACSTHTGASFSVYWYNEHFPQFRDEIDAEGRYLAGLSMQNPTFPTAYEVLQAERDADLVEQEGSESLSTPANPEDSMIRDRVGRINQERESSKYADSTVPRMPSTLRISTSAPEKEGNAKESTGYEQTGGDEEAEHSSIIVKVPRKRWLSIKNPAGGQPIWPSDHRINPDGGVYLPTGLHGFPEPLGWKNCTKEASRGRIYWYPEKDFARKVDGTLDGPCLFCEVKRHRYNEKRRKKSSE